MFKDKSKRYMTRAVAETIDIEIQRLLWDLIDEQKELELELDYLQVFELSIKEGKQHIVHRQEVPERVKEWTLALDFSLPVNSTIWCIDDGSNQTMLFPSDY